MFELFQTLKDESSAANASHCLCFTVKDLISTGASSKAYVCLHLGDSVSICAHVRVCFQKMTPECADMPAHSTLNASMTFSYGLLSPHACAHNHTVADKSPNYWGCSYSYNNSAVVLNCWLSACLVFWIDSPQPLFMCVYTWTDVMTLITLAFLPFYPIGRLPNACLDTKLSLKTMNRKEILLLFE